MIKFTRIIELANIEGSVISLVKCEDDKIYFQGKSESMEIICPTTAHTVYLYLTQITLNQAFLMSESEPYLIIDKGQTSANYIDSSKYSVPSIIAGLTFGDILFQQIPKDSRIQKPIPEILSLLPEAYDGLKIEKVENIDVLPCQINFFADDSPVNIVNIHSEENSFDFDYLKVKLMNGDNYLLCPVTPIMLKLLFTGLRIKDFFMCQLNQDFFQYTKNGVYIHSNSTGLQAMIENLWYGDYSYFQIPAEFRTDEAIERLGYYEKNVLLPGGFGQRPLDFPRDFPVEIKIERR